MNLALILEYQVNQTDHQQSLGDFLKSQSLSKKALIALKHQGGEIRVNHHIRTTRHGLKRGDVVQIKFPPERVSEMLMPIKMSLKIVYEDDFLLIIDKVAGLPVMPTGSHDVSLANGILAYYNDIGLSSTVHFINRLDRGTSGLLIVAKYRHIHHLMTLSGEITRQYYAQVSGRLQGSGLIDAPIFRPDVTTIKRIIDPRGQKARTHYEEVKAFLNNTLVKCQLETGRTHQIRIHLAHLGHPILKDPIYGMGAVDDCQLLHSYYLSFIHPVSGAFLKFETDLPQRFYQN